MATAIAVVVLVGKLVDSDGAAELRRGADDADRDRDRADRRGRRAALTRRELGGAAGGRGRRRRWSSARSSRSTPPSASSSSASRCVCLGRNVRGADAAALLAALIAGLALLGLPVRRPRAAARAVLAADADGAADRARHARAERGPDRGQHGARAARPRPRARRRAAAAARARGGDRAGRARLRDARRACAATGSTSAKGSRCSAPR